MKLKPEYIGMSIKIKHPKLGDLVFLSDTPEEKYPFFAANGFAFMFEPKITPKKQSPRLKKYKGIILSEDEQDNAPE